MFSNHLLLFKYLFLHLKAHWENLEHDTNPFLLTFFLVLLGKYKCKQKFVVPKKVVENVEN